MKTTPAEASALEYARALPLPALVTDQELTPIFRNELARRLLPSKARLRRLLAARLPVEAKNELFFLSVDRVSYLVISFAASGGLRIVAFLENTVPLHTPFAKQMVEEGALVLDELYKARSTALPPLPNSSKESTDRSAALAARCVAVRNRMRSFHQLFILLEKKTSKPCSLSIPGLLRLISQRLSGTRTDLLCSPEDPEKCACILPPEILVALVLNLVRFVMVYVGGEGMELSLVRSEERHLLTLGFSDRHGLFEMLSELLNHHFSAEREELSSLLPLLLSIVICRRYGIGLEASASEGKGQIEVSFKATAQKPEFFLGTRPEEEETLLREWVAEIFF